MVCGNTVGPDSDRELDCRTQPGLRATQSPGTNRRNQPKCWKEASDEYPQNRMGDGGDSPEHRPGPSKKRYWFPEVIVPWSAAIQSDLTRIASSIAAPSLVSGLHSRPAQTDETSPSAGRRPQMNTHRIGWAMAVIVLSTAPAAPRRPPGRRRAAV